MSRRAAGQPEPGTSYGQLLVDGEWVEITVDENGQFVTPDGEEVPWDDVTDFGRYESTIIVDGERVHAYEATSLSGALDRGLPSPRSTFRTADGASADTAGEITEVPAYQYSVITDDGMVEHRYGHGAAYTVDDDGNAVFGHGQDVRYEIDFHAIAEFGGRTAVVGIDGDGEQVLLTRSGEPIDVEVDWSQVTLSDPPPLAGDPIAIGDYVFDARAGIVERVYLFPDGSQAIKDDGGEFQRVIVPTDAEYPDGRPFFEGTFFAQEGRGELDPAEYSTVFSYADGQTATYVDGELVLVDMAVEADYPDGPPVACGKFPGGELFVFPDGRQLLRANDGTWGVGALPDLPPYDELVERFGEADLDAVLDLPVPTPSLPDDLLIDDIAGPGPGMAGSLELSVDAGSGDGSGSSSGDDAAVTGEPVSEEPVSEEPVDDGAAVGEPELADPFESDPTELSDPADTDVTLGEDSLDAGADLGADADGGLFDDA